MSATRPPGLAVQSAPTPVEAAWRQLADRGLGREQAVRLGFRIDADGNLVAPVRDASGTLVGSRRYRGTARGADPIRTPREPDFEHGHVIWDHTGGMEARAHVARPPVGSASRAGHDIRVVIVEDEVAAEVASRELGVTAIAPAHEQQLDLEAQAAARLAEGGGVLIALDRSARTDVDLTWSTRLERAAAVVEDAGSSALQVRLPIGGSIEAELAAGRPLMIRPVAIGRVRLATTWAPQRELVALFGTVLKTGIRLWVQRGVFTRVNRGQDSHRTVESMSDRYKANLAAVEEVQHLAPAFGVRLGLYGGLATDTTVGRPVREHRDADLTVVAGSRADIMRFYAACVERGFRPIVHMPGRYAHFARHDATLDIQESARLSSGRALLGRNRLSAFPEECLAPSRPFGGHELRTMRSDLLVGLAWEHLLQPRTTFVRTELLAGRKTQLDLAALLTTMGASSVREAIALRAELKSTRFYGDTSVIVPSELQHLVRTHCARLARLLVGRR